MDDINYPQALVSVIMPAYNAQEFIRESIQSVIDQTYLNWELIIIDDGSTDLTAELVNRYVITDQRVKYIYQQNGKQGKARNKGIQHSKGGYLAFLDADDTWVKDKLAIQLVQMQTNPEISLVFSQGYTMQNGKVQPYLASLPGIWDKTTIPILIKENTLAILSVLVKKEALAAVGNFSEDPLLQNVEDYDLWLKLLYAHHTFLCCPEKLFYYRIHGKQSTFKNNNTILPLHYLYKKIYHQYAEPEFKQAIIQKLKWGIYHNHIRKEVLVLILDYFKQKKKIRLPLETIFKIIACLPRKLYLKIAVKLVAAYA